MNKKSFISSLKSMAHHIYEWPVFLSLLFGTVTTWIIKEPITPYLFNNRQYAESGWIFKLFFISFCFLTLSLIYFGIFSCYQKYSRKKKKVGLNTININIPVAKRILLVVNMICICMLAILLINIVFPHIDTETWSFRYPEILPTLESVGDDFRTGLYRPPYQLFFEGKEYIQYPDGTFLTQYPPLVNLLYLPFQLFNENQAYLIHVVFLILANITCLGISAHLLKDYILPMAGLEKATNRLIALFLFMVLSVFTFTSYPFLFSIERGNYDIIALLFTLVSIDLLIRTQKTLWLQVILLSIAIHLKIYPAALLILLFFKHGKKIFLPVLVVNGAFLFILGPQNAITFLQIVMNSIEKGFPWVFNHSGVSFATYLTWIYQSTSGNIVILRNFFTMIPVVIWSLSSFRLIKNGLSEINLIGLFMVTLPLMDLVPSISHDYKSVILGPALMILLAILIVKIMLNSALWDYFQVILVMGIMLILGRSYALNPANLVLLNIKYPIIILFALLMMKNMGIPKLENKSAVMIAE